MSTRYLGNGILQLNCGIDLPQCRMAVFVDRQSDDPQQGVRLMVKDSLPGGCTMQITFSEETAAQLAEEIHRLASATVATEACTTETEPPHRAPWLTMTA